LFYHVWEHTRREGREESAESEFQLNSPIRSRENCTQLSCISFAPLRAFAVIRIWTQEVEAKKISPRKQDLSEYL
jgi:hypothetical protein